MRAASIAALAALAFGGQAMAADFIVVSSTEPSVKTGQALDAGAHLAVSAGRTLTVMRPSGATGPGDAVKFAAVQALFKRPPSGHAFGAQRGFCPGPEALDNIGAIVRSDQAGCKADARSAFQDYLKAHGVAAADADALYASTAVADADTKATR
jgi:hypothetical protein